MVSYSGIHGDFKTKMHFVIYLQCRGAASYICLFGLQQPKLKKKVFKEKVFITPQKFSLCVLLCRAIPFSLCLIAR